jgi:WD40 repeat protein
MTHRPGAALPSVPAVRDSVLDLAAELHRRCGIPEGNVTAVVDPSSPLEFGRALERAAAQARDTLIVYFVGHGLIGPGADLYLATCVTDDLTGGLPYTALPYTALLQAVRNSQARAVAVVLDCCFSGLADAPAGPPALDSVFEQSGVRGGFLLTSTARDELGLAAPGAAHTAFTGAVIELLREGDPAGPRQLTLDHLYRHLHRVLPERGAPRPRRQSSDRAGELALAANPAYTSRPAPPVSDEQTDYDDAREPCPYRGLAAYGPQDEAVYFGRRELVEDLAQRITADGGLIAVVGASGSGKTSVLRAGVLPLLEQVHGWKTAVITPGADPIGALASATALFAGCDRGVLVIDQFEELFTAGATDQDLERFLRAVGEFSDGPITVVFAVRADLYDACTNHPLLVDALNHRQVVIGPMGTQDLRAVIEKPAHAAGLTLEQGLADMLLQEIGALHTSPRGTVLPLLSHALVTTWQKRSGRTLTKNGYRDAGGIEGAVEKTAEEVYVGLTPDDQARARTLLLRLVRVGDGVEDSRRRLALADLADPDQVEPVRHLLGTLAAARLVTVDDESVEIIHEALLRAWPRLRTWIAEDRTDLLASQQLADAALLWERDGRQSADLYRGARLEAALRARRQTALAAAIGPLGHRFLDESAAQQRAEQAVAHRRRRRNRTLAAILATLVLLTASITAISLHEQSQATLKAEILRSSDLASDAQALRAYDPGAAAQLAIAAYRSWPTQAAISQLYASTTATPLDGIIADTGHAVLDLTAQSAGPLTAAVDSDGSVEVWNLANPAAPVQETALHASPSPIALAPHAPLLAGVCGTATLCLWNLANASEPVVAARIDVAAAVASASASMAISPDGTVLADIFANGETLLYSIAQPAHPRLLANLSAPARQTSGTDATLAFSPHGHLLAASIVGGTTRLWNIADPAKPTELSAISNGQPGGYNAIAFSPDGTMLAGAGSAGLDIWKVAVTPGSAAVDLGSVSGDGDQGYETVAFSSDGDQLAYFDADTKDSNAEVCLADTSPGALTNGLFETCAPIGFHVSRAAYAVGGALITGGADGTVRAWTQPLPQFGDLFAYDTTGFGINPNGTLVAAMAGSTSAADPSEIPVDIWSLNASGGRTLDAALPIDGSELGFLNSELLVTVATSGAVQLWDLGDPRHPVQTASLGTAASPYYVGKISYQVAHDGNLVSVRGDDGEIHLWTFTAHGAATQVGTIPAPGRTPAELIPGHRAVIISSTGFEWWDIRDPAHPERIGSTPFADPYNAVAAGGSFVAASAPAGGGADSTLMVWPGGTASINAPVTLSKSLGSQIGISADGRLLAVSGPGNNTLTLWDLSDPAHPKLRSTIRTTDGIQNIAFDANGTLMAVSGNSASNSVTAQNGTVQLWRVDDPSAPVLQTDLTPPTRFSDDLAGAELSASGHTLLVSTQSAVYSYDTDVDEIASRLCTMIGQPISTALWQEYAPGVAYQRPCP